MQIDHFGKFRVKLIPFELPGGYRRAPYPALHAFDDGEQDFVCVMEKRRASAKTGESPAEAIDEARRIANYLIEKRKLRES
jgi:hypothetical protein